MGVSKTLSTNSALCSMNFLCGPVGTCSLFKALELSTNPSNTGGGLSKIPTQYGYGVDNLLLPQRAYKMRTIGINSSTLSFSFGIDVSISTDGVYSSQRSFQPTMFAVIGSNISKTSGNGFNLTGSSSQLFTSPVVYSNLQLYDSEGSDILLWYLDTPSSGTLLSGLPYWRIDFTPDATWTSDSFIEISSFFLGCHYPFDADYGTSSGLQFYSKAGNNYNGSRFYKRKSTKRTIDMNSTLLTPSDRRNLSNDIKLGRNSIDCIIDSAANLPDTTPGRGRGLMYGYIGARSSRSFNVDKYGTFDVSVTESP